MRPKNSKLRMQKRFIFNRSAAFTPVRREEIYGSEHIFDQLEPIFDYLTNFRSYHQEGIPVDGGALLCGSPGMGKTMFARYIASKSKARFVNAREFPVELKSGAQIWQPRDIAALFRFSAEWVRQYNQPVVLFIDQLDDFLKSNSSDIENQFELELDGFLARGSGIFLLATSQVMPNGVAIDSGDDDDDPSPLGGSLFRRGRIGIHIPFVRPDFPQRVKLLNGFLAEHPHADGIDVDSLVYLLKSPTPADLKYAVSEAHQLARREMVKAGTKSTELKDAKITQEHLKVIFLSKTLDRETGHTLTDRERYEACVHELGHYLVARALGIAARFASVRPGLNTLGITFANDDTKSLSLEHLRREVTFCCGSWEAEKLCGVPPNTGKSGDLDDANDIAQQLVFFGERKSLKSYGPLRVERDVEEGTGMRVSQKALVAYEKDVANIILAEERRARNVLRFFGGRLIEKVARILQKNRHGVMLQKELDALFEPKLSEFHRLHKIVDRIYPTT